MRRMISAGAEQRGLTLRCPLRPADDSQPSRNGLELAAALGSNERSARGKRQSSPEEARQGP